jgi:hypothetical protein
MQYVSNTAARFLHQVHQRGELSLLSRQHPPYGLSGRVARSPQCRHHRLGVGAGHSREQPARRLSQGEHTQAHSYD